MKTLFALVATVLLAACAPANAPAATQTASADAPAPAASVVQRALAGNGLSISGTLEAPKGYQGYVATYQGQTLPVYVLPDGKHIMVGTLFDLAGHDLTAAAFGQGQTVGEDAWKQLEAADWFAEGNPKATRIVYAFEDTRCPYCHLLWQKSKPYLQRGKVQIRTLLVGVIAPESLPEAAKILDAKDPAAAWNQSEENFGKHPAPADDASAAALAKVRANTLLMQKLGIMGTPGVVWKDTQGRIHVSQGMPRDDAGLTQMLGD